MRFYDNTMLSDFKQSPRRYYYRHFRGWVPNEPALPLIFGGCWHEAMDVIWTKAPALFKGAIGEVDKRDLDQLVVEAIEAFEAKWEAEGLSLEMSMDELAKMEPHTPQVAKEMLYGYLEKRARLFADPAFELLNVERPFAVPLDPDDESLWYVGRLDKEFRKGNQVFVGEHKTSSLYRKDTSSPFRADFVDSFSPNAQIDGYLYAGRQHHGDAFGGVWIDAALVHRSVHTGFMWIPLDRQGEHLDSWLWGVHYWIDNIEGSKAALEDPACKQAPYMAAFPCTGCSGYTCPYRILCKSLANPHREEEPPMGFRHSPWSPFDLLKLQQLFPDEVKPAADASA